MSFIFKQFFDRNTSTYSYLVADSESRQAALFDTVKGYREEYVASLRGQNLHLKYLFETHVHADHITSNSELIREYPEARVAIHRDSTVKCPHITLSDNDKLTLGALEIVALHTPGHTSDSITYLVNGDRLLTGDTLLINSCGRTDFQAGNSELMFKSLKRLTEFPPETLVYPGHDYNKRRVSSIGEQMETNLLLKKSFDEFKAELASWNLAPPARIHESVAGNLKCGE